MSQLAAGIDQWLFGRTNPTVGGSAYTPMYHSGLMAGSALLIPWSMLIQRWLYGVPGASMHSVRSMFRLDLFARAFLIVGAVWVVVMFAQALLMPVPSAPWQPADLLGVLVVTLLLTPLASAGEEYGLRGLVFRVAGSWAHGPRTALVIGVLVSALVFTVIHLATDPWLSLYYFTFGVTTALITWRTGGLETAVVIHALTNTIAFMLVLVVGGDLLTGLTDRSTGAGSVVLLLPCGVLLAVTAVVWWRTRRHRTGADLTQHLTTKDLEISRDHDRRKRRTAIRQHEAGYVVLSRAVVNTGAYYAYVAFGLGRRAGAATAFIATIAYNAATAGMAAATGYFTDLAVTSHTGLELPWWLYAALALTATGLLGYAGVSIAARATTVICGVQFALLAALVVAVLVRGAGRLTAEVVSPTTVFGSGLGLSVVFVLLSFSGYEATAAYCEEARDARRTVARVTYFFSSCSASCSSSPPGQWSRPCRTSRSRRRPTPARCCSACSRPTSEPGRIPRAAARRARSDPPAPLHPAHRGRGCSSGSPSCSSHRSPWPGSTRWSGCSRRSPGSPLSP